MMAVSRPICRKVFPTGEGSILLVASYSIELLSNFRPLLCSFSLFAMVPPDLGHWTVAQRDTNLTALVGACKQEKKLLVLE